MLFKLKDNLPNHPMVKEAEKATQNTPDVYDVMVSDYVLNLQVGGAVVGTAGFVFLNFFSIQPSVAWVGFNNNLDLSNSDNYTEAQQIAFLMVFFSYMSAFVGVLSLGLILASWDCASRDVAESDSWCLFDLFAPGPPYICTPVPKCTEEPNFGLDSACCGLGEKCAATEGPWDKPEKADELR